MLNFHRFARLRQLRIAAIGYLGIVTGLLILLWDIFVNADVVASKWPGSKTMPAEMWLIFASFLFLAVVAFWPELDKAEQPDVALVWDWPEEYKKTKNLIALGEIEKSILVHNRSDTWVYNIQITSISLGEDMVFDGINEIAPHGTHPALARWGQQMEKSSFKTNYVYFFSANESALRKKKWVYKKLHNRGFSENFMKIPMRITYHANKRDWESKFSFIYDPGDESFFEKRSQRRL